MIGVLPIEKLEKVWVTELDKVERLRKLVNDLIITIQNNVEIITQ